MPPELPARVSLRRCTPRLLCLYVACLPLLWPARATASGKVLVAADLAFLALVCAAAVERSWLPLERRLALLAGLPIAATTLSALHSPEPALALPTLFRVGYSMLVLLVVAHLRLSEAERTVVLRAWVVTAAATALLALGQFSGVALGLMPENALVSSDYDSLGHQVLRSGAWLVHPNTLAVYLDVSLALILLAAARAQPGARPALLALLLAAAQTFSRSLASIAVTLWLAARALAGRLPWFARARVLLLAAAVALLACAALTTRYGVFPVSLNASRLEINPRPNRYYVLELAALRMLRERPAVGVGPGRYARELLRVTSADEQRDSFPEIASDVAYDPHSSWFGQAAECGLIGLGAWLTLCGWIGRALLADAADPEVLWRKLTACALAGVAISGLHIEVVHLKFVWAAAGLALATRDRRV